MYLGLTAIAGFSAGGAVAQTYPSKPMRIVVPFAPGGSTDILARTIASHLEKRYGVPVVVENRPGGATVVGAMAVAKADPDAHTLLLASDTTYAINPHVLLNTPFDPIRELAPVSVIGNAPNWIVVAENSPLRNFDDFVRAVKENPGKISTSVNSIGGQVHLVLNAWARRNQLDLTIVPYPGVARAIPDLFGGNLNAICDVVGGTARYVEDGKMRALALFQSTPSNLVKTPSYTESGQKDLDIVTSFVMFTTAGSRQANIDKVSAEIASILKEPDVAEKLRSLAISPVGLDPAQTSAFILRENARFKKIVEETGFKL
ncbi:MAG: tripartite tricarboxylate transporter substrate binding protein [Burkholderiaceae bacterium]|nr:tripartite tricarboxylate transporter substrate binding protein [Burkholderiaceae bacterium]